MIQEPTQPQDKLVPALGNESKLDAVKTAELFPGFEWKEGMAPPEELDFNEFGFPEDAQGNWYLTRSAKPTEHVSDIGVGDLFNRTKHRYLRSFFGSGLYFGNHVSAVKTADRPRNRHPRGHYVARFNPGEAPVFVAPAGLRESETGSMIGKLLVRTVAVGFLPHPPRKVYDRVFGDAAAAVTKPTYKFGGNVEINGRKIKPKWIVVRDLSRLEIAGYRDLLT